MATATVKTNPTYVLNLNQTEAELIKALVQNCLLANYADEAQVDRLARESIWDALNQAGVK